MRQKTFRPPFRMVYAADEGNKETRQKGILSRKNGYRKRALMNGVKAEAKDVTRGQPGRYKCSEFNQKPRARR